MSFKKSKSFHFFKRLFDIFFSFILIIALSWFLIIVGVILLCPTHCKPIYLDSRVGYEFKKIKILKFRSMYYDAETNINKYLTPEQILEWNNERKVDNDPRVTKFGKIIRKLSIDELPQLFNIFIGDMSFVGPRPITEYELNTYYTDEEQKLLLSTRPGLTGNWQACGRNNITHKSGERQKLELEYVKKQSVWFDIKLILLTIPSVISCKGSK